MNGPLALVHVDAADFAALAGSCTLGDCLLTYDATTQQLSCSCHGCAFALSGAVVNGPATVPLIRYATAFDGKTVTVTVAT